MTRPRGLRVLVVDEDRRIRRLVERTLAPPEFTVFVFEDAGAALLELGEIEPDVILCEGKSLGGVSAQDFLKTLRASRHRLIPFVVLATDPIQQREIAPLLGPRDACLLKPVPVPILTGHLRSAAQRGGARAARATHTLAGQTDRHGLLALLKLCEDARLTGRFSLEAKGQKQWVDWLAGTPVGSGANPGPDGDAFERFLESEGGHYVFEPRLVKGGARSGPHGAFAADTKGGMGRFTVVEVDDRRYQVYTEGFHGPNFTVTTVVAVAGRGLRKIEMGWPHPMKRDDDSATSRDYVAQQHEAVLRMVQNKTLLPQPLRKVWDVAGGGIEGSVLVAALTLLRDSVRDRIGLVPTIALLRQTRRQLLKDHAALEAFHLSDDGRVQIQVEGERGLARTTLTGWRLPRGTLEGVALWTVSFRDEAALLAGPPRLPSIRRATRMLAEELERIGFYAAIEEQISTP